MSVSKIRYIRSLIGYLCVFTAVSALSSAADARVSYAKTKYVNPRYASLVVDGDTGNVLHAENANAQRYPASLTKMMTLYLLFEALQKGTVTMDTMLPVSKYAASKPQTNLFLRGGDKIPVRTAIYALIIRSANDVAVVVGEKLGRSEWEFAKMMTQKARSLGMNSTVFRNANGLPDAHQVTTARDMAVLAMALKSHFPQYYSFFKAQSFSFRGRTYTTHNRAMLMIPGGEGMKTGYINASGFNVVTTVTQKGKHLVGVVMGGRTAATRDAHMVKLIGQSYAMLEQGRTNTNYATRNMKPVAVASAQKPSAFRQAPVPVAKPQVLLSNNTVPVNTGQAILNMRPTNGQPLVPPQYVVMNGRYVAAQQTIQQPAEEATNYVAADTNQPIPAPMAVLQTQGQFMAAVQPQPQPQQQLAEVTEKPWAIQVGAYYRAPEAIMAANNASRMAMDVLAGAKIAVSNGTEQSSGMEIHRARLANLDEAQAHQACQKLIAMRQSCFVIRPN